MAALAERRRRRSIDVAVHAAEDLLIWLRLVSEALQESVDAFIPESRNAAVAAMFRAAGPENEDRN